MNGWQGALLGILILVIVHYADQAVKKLGEVIALLREIRSILTGHQRIHVEHTHQLDWISKILSNQGNSDLDDD